MTIHPCRDPIDAAKQAGALLSGLLVQKPLLLFLSGGSSLDLLDYTDTSGLNEQVAIGVLDERGDNFARLRETRFFAEAQKKGIHTMDLEEGALRAWKGRIVITLGIGPDGHTAGILPYPEDAAAFEILFNDPNHWVVGYDAAGKNPYPLRVTVTLPFLRQVDASVVYACGKGKKEALTRLIAREGSLAETPARITCEMKRVSLFTDLPVSR